MVATFLDPALLPLGFNQDFDTLWRFGRLRSANTHNWVGAELTAVATRIFCHLSKVIGLDLKLQFAASGSEGTEQAWSQSGGIVAVGIGLLQQLDDACLEFVWRLLSNYVTQTLGFGPSVPLPLLSPACRFASDALALYAGHMTPKAFDPAGQSRGDYVGVTASSMTFRNGATLSMNDFARATGFLAKPFMFAANPVPAETVLPALSGEPFPHLLLLYGKLLSDALTLILAHEAAHIALGHTDTDIDTPARSRQDEVAADHHALGTLAKLPGVDVRSTILLFAFLGSKEPTRLAPARLSHPLATDRLGLLAAAVDRQRDAYILADLNAGLRLVRRKVANVSGAGRAWAATDLNFTSFLNLEGLPETLQTGQLEITLGLSIRNRTHPAAIYRTGEAKLSVAADTLQQGLPIAPPPSWWLDHTEATLVVDRVEVSTTAAAARAAVFTCPTHLQDDALIAAFTATVTSAPEWAKLAAQAAWRTEPREVANTLGTQAVTNLALQDADLLEWLANQAGETGQYAQGERLLRSALKSWPYIRPGLRGLLAALKLTLFNTGNGQDIALLEAGFDLLMRENALDPQNAIVSAMLPQFIRGQVAADFVITVMAAIKCNQEANTQLQSNPAGAAPWFAKAAAQLEAAIASALTPPAFAWQLLGETRLSQAAHGDKNFAPAADAFQKVTEIDPSFLPAWTELAKLALEQGDLVAADAALCRAEAINPIHAFAQYVRKEQRRRMGVAVDAALQAAQQALSNNQPTQALAALAGVDGLAPLDHRIDMQSAYVRFHQGDLPAARALLDRAMTRAGDDFDLLLLLGQIRVEEGHPRAAYECLTLALGAAAHLPKSDDLNKAPYEPLPYACAKGIACAHAVRALALGQLAESAPMRADCDETQAKPGTSGLALFDLAELHRLRADRPAAAELLTRALTAPDWQMAPRHTAAAKRFLAGAEEPLLPTSLVR